MEWSTTDRSYTYMHIYTHPVVGDGPAEGGGEEEVLLVVVEPAGLVRGGAHHDAVRGWLVNGLAGRRDGEPYVRIRGELRTHCVFTHMHIYIPISVPEGALALLPVIRVLVLAHEGRVIQLLLLWVVDWLNEWVDQRRMYVFQGGGGWLGVCVWVSGCRRRQAGSDVCICTHVGTHRVDGGAARLHGDGREGVVPV